MAGNETTETNEETFGFSTSQRSTRSKQKQLMSTNGQLETFQRRNSNINYENNDLLVNVTIF